MARLAAVGPEARPYRLRILASVGGLTQRRTGNPRFKRKAAG